MKTYLLAWNPKKWQWEDLAEFSEAVKLGIKKSIRWSCGRSKRLKEGDRAFFIRLGEMPKGIFASGVIKKRSFQDIHWDDEKASVGGMSYYVQVEFDVLLNPDVDDILPREFLDTPTFSQMHWNTQLSGVLISENIADALEIAWENFNNNDMFFLPEEIENTGALFEGAVKKIVINAYERNTYARRKCIAHYGTRCFICGFNFEKTYGKVGVDFIHVHHLKLLSEIGNDYKVDPVRDLRPVCPNCHAMIHRRNPPYSIDEMFVFLTDA